MTSADFLFILFETAAFLMASNNLAGKQMVCMVILTHGLFGEELFRAAEMIVGKQDKVELISMQTGFALSDVSKRLEEVINIYSEDSVIVFTDMFGGSPSNISMAYLKENAVEVVSGVNLPMLLRAFGMRMEGGHSLDEIAAEAAEAGKASIKVAGTLLNKRK